MDIMTIEHNGRTYTNVSPAEALQTGVPQDVINQALAGERRENIKAECRRRIYGRASTEAQMNINGAAALAGAKTASQRSEAEAALLVTYALSVQWIMDMRAAVETLSADADADYLADAAWPECPVEVVALASQF